MDKPKEPRFQDYADEILRNKLYVGSLEAACLPLPLLQQVPVSHIVSIGRIPVCKYPDALTYCTLSLYDVPETSLFPAILPALQFIQDHLHQPETKGLLIHCRQGRSRSLALLLAWWIQSTDWSLDHAWQYVRSRRPCAQPNPGFWKQLRQWEQMRGSLPCRLAFSTLTSCLPSLLMAEWGVEPRRGSGIPSTKSSSSSSKREASPDSTSK